MSILDTIIHHPGFWPVVCGLIAVAIGVIIAGQLRKKRTTTAEKIADKAEKRKARGEKKVPSPTPPPPPVPTQTAQEETAATVFVKPEGPETQQTRKTVPLEQAEPPKAEPPQPEIPQPEPPVPELGTPQPPRTEPTAPVSPAEPAPAEYGRTLPLEMPRQSQSANWKIRGVSGQYQGRAFDLYQSLRIGRRPDNDIVFAAETPGVSGEHCEVVLRGEQVVLLDKGASYGVFVNNRVRLHPHTGYYLEPGDVFSLAEGGPSFRLEYKSAGSAAYI